MIADRFGREVSEPVMLGYYDHLAKHLTTDEFQAAARHIFNEDTYWPAPARFVELAKGKPAELAEADWQKLLASCSRGDTNIETFSPEAIAGMRAAGGWRGVAYAAEGYALDARKREFKATWLAAHENEKITRLALMSGDAQRLPS